MTIKQSLIWANKKLQPLKRTDHNDTPLLDAEILLSFVIKKPKEFLYAHPEKKLTAAQILKFKNLIARRARHEPIAYITGYKFFYGLDFFVNKNVLIPRPETETLVETAINKSPTTIVDVGTGSGAIAISLAKNLPNAKIFATEISPGAIKVARKNIRRHRVNVTLLRGDLLKPFLNLKSKTRLPARQVSNLKSLIIVANLPYLTTRQWQKTQPEIKKYEPRLALDGGTDGLKYYKQLFNQIKLLITNYSLLVASIFEIDPSQKKSIVNLIKHRFPAAKIEIKKDLAGRDRVVIAKTKN